MTRPPEPRPPVIGTFLTALLLFTSLPLLANAQQQRFSRHDRYTPLPRGKSTWPETLRQHDPSLTPENDDRLRYQNNKKNAVSPTDVSALATLAPAGSTKDRVVRAPPARSTGPTGGLSSRLPARSLQDWEVEDIVLLATVDGTIHARDRKTGAARWALEADRPMVETIYHQQNKSVNGARTVGDDFLWIVEPSQDGSLYGYTPGSAFGMQKLGLTVKQMVELSPYAVEDPPLVYNGKKENTLYTVDVNSGHILTVFSSSNAAVMDQGKCRRANSLEALDDDECGVTGTLTLGRTEYTVRITNRVTQEPICTIKYFEWGPNNRDQDLSNQYSTTKDNRYIYSMYDGRVLALDHRQDVASGLNFARKPTYKQKFVSPVARVFDVARPLHSSSRDTPLIILPQPTGPSYEDTFTSEGNHIFVNCTEAGSWYALSENAYPMVTEGALPAQCSRDDWLYSVPTVDGTGDSLRRGLVGVHSLNYHETIPRDVPLISGPVENHSLEDINEVNANIESSPILSVSGGPFSLGPSYMQSLFALVLIGLSILAAHSWSSKPSGLVTPDTLKGPEQGPVTFPPVVAEVISNPPDQMVVADMPNVVRFDDAYDETISTDLIQVQPATTATDLQSETATQEVEVVVGAGEEVSKKKKAHRGSRGGKREKEKQGKSSPRAEFVDAIDSIVEGVKQMGHDVSVEPDGVTVMSPATEDGTTGLHNLVIHTDQILGNGSGGTFVFGGSFEGRDVAVKRMLPQFTELVKQEVSLLEQSEEHPNVIRYFCQRKDQHFLYIALERCQASLWDMFRDGRGDETPDEKYASLINDITLDPKRVLRQLAEGLAYLHRFRIVHRDIKPQNMLIAYPKKNNLASFPRLVISDFGLCKTLPDNASTLIGATSNAGTAGWKAPELIFQPKEVSGNGINGSQHSTGKDSLNGDIPPGAQGVKRAVDIFSLGCVFFYVLTRGQHPFDDDEGWMQLRERNIKTNRANLASIQLFGDDTVDLIEWMLCPKPEDRPTASQVLAHPFFWTPEDRLEFLSTASDRFDQEPRDGTSIALAELERHAEKIIATPLTTTGGFSHTTAMSHHRSSSSENRSYHLALFPEPNFLSHLDKKFVDTLGKQRKYSGNKLVDLLRALRNKHHHWDDMPEDVKVRVGELPDGYLRYWEDRFPGLVVGVWRSVRGLGMGGERRFWRYFGGREG